MRSQFFRLSAIAAGGALAAGLAGWSLSIRAQAAPETESKTALTQGFTKGEWDHKAIGPLSFSPSGVLFFADDQGGAVYGVDLGEKPSKAAAFTRVPDLGATLASRLGTTAAGIEIKDMAVSPVSHCTYISVRKTDGGDQNPANPANYALFMVDPAGKVTPVDLKDKPFGKVAVSGKPSYTSRGMGVPRVISDIAYAKGRVLATSLSSEQFNSNLVSVPVPFRADGVERYATSIYHVSHKKQETASPIQTLAIYRDGDKEWLMAAYVCTPVVRFNLADLKPGQVVTGTTVAELGSGNRPMDMIAYGKAGQQSLLLNNSSFGILKVDSKIAKEMTAVNEMTTADRGGRGMKPYPGIEPVEALKDAKAYAAGSDTMLLVVKPSAEGLALEPMPLP
jgi:hypothetical protein